MSEPKEFDKVDRALEMQVIDWLQWGEFDDSLLKHPNGEDMAQLTLKLIAKRKAAYEALKAKLAELQSYAELHKDDYVREVGSWKIIQRLEEHNKDLEAKLDVAVEALEFISDNLGYQESPPFPAPIVYAADRARQALAKLKPDTEK